MARPSDTAPGERFARRIQGLAQSEIRRMSVECEEHGGINLGQGICDQPVPQAIKDAAVRAIAADLSTYSRLEGIDQLRRKIAGKMQAYNGVTCDPASQVVVTVGSTGAFVAACMAALDPGDEVVLFSPFYGYHLNILAMLGVTPRFVTLRPPDWTYDAAELRAAFTPRTRAVIINTPANPCGKVFSQVELEQIGELCHSHHALAITDEIYEYILYDGHQHVSMASLPGMAEHTLTLSGFSKTYNMTGWRLGYVVGPEPLIKKIGIVNDLISICAPTPLQHALVAAFDLPESYYSDMRRDYARKLELICAACTEAGLTPLRPQGAYYLLVDVASLGLEDDRQAATALLRGAGVATVPGSSFHADPAHGRHQVRICFAKRDDDLEEACRRLRRLPDLALHEFLPG